MTKTERKALERIASKLDQTLADSDITHLENDDDILMASPGQWACSEINKLLQSVQTEELRTSVSDAMVNRFLSWRLPPSVCADPCASMPGYPARIGTNLLTAVEARQMLEHVLSAPPAPAKVVRCPDCGSDDPNDCVTPTCGFGRAK